jgi:hypothetical protein
MASLLELYDYAQTPEYAALRKKIAVACAKKAKAIGDLASPTAEQVAWARSTLQAPDSAAGNVIHYVLAANAGATLAQISAATDAAIETAVGNAVDKLLSL